MQLINLTPHPITIALSNDTFIVPTCNKIARVSTKKDLLKTIIINDVEVPIYFTTFGEVELTSSDGSIEEFPEQKAGVLYIVSSIVKNAMMDRADVVVPTEFIRDDVGNIIGCKGFSI